MKLPNEMCYVDITAPGGSEMLSSTMGPIPVPSRGEILIKVAAAGVNRPDILQRQGRYKPPTNASTVPGLEVAGTVAAVGENCGNWQLNDTVCALVAGGGYAEYCVAPTPQCLPSPSPLTLIEAAGIPENYFTVWTNVFQKGSLQAGESILIHGGSSGIGTTAIQLAKHFGAKVIATAGSDEKCRACDKLGALRSINYRREDFVEVVSELTGRNGVELILDMVGGSYIERNIQSLAVGGRLVQIAFLTSSEVSLDLRPIMTKRLVFTGSTLRPQTVSQKGAIASELRKFVWPLLEAQKIKPIIYKTFPLSRASDAHRLMESSTHIGKIILTT
ncbi:MAG: NAD(P)H-quinone oxidoreductase [Acidiferrobacteraceae bacterium]|nr:NAD(P)H-quinone oxidoreductase [Acidiferrobacteraceae bacterium]